MEQLQALCGTQGLNFPIACLLEVRSKEQYFSLNTALFSKEHFNFFLKTNV